MQRLTLDRTRELTKEIIDQTPEDFVYLPIGQQGCYYDTRSLEFLKATALRILRGVEPDESDPRITHCCLVGEVLKRHDPEMYAEIASADSSIYELVRDYNMPVQDNALEYLGNLQQSQDGGHTWHEAYSFAEDSIGKRSLTCFCGILHG
jgi:hypothetical protein